ncbi:MAG: radical SAM protein [Synergistaceae bacterium]|nr:radical SAM protein [Synergistaceae bacterium]
MRALRKFPFFLPFGGCRGRCVYCNQRAITGSSDIPSPDAVRSALAALTEPVEVCYFGGSFCRFGYDAVKDYLDAVNDSAPNGSRVRFSTYPGDLSDDRLRDMVLSHPIACVELGVPSLDPHVLQSCKREACPGAILENIVQLRDECVTLAVQMMIGLPGQTVESSIGDLRAIAELKGPLDWQLRIYPCLVINGTELSQMAKDGDYTPLTIDEAVNWGGAFMDEAFSLGFTPIRAGLQESELLASEVRGGPHHPALGELIFSEAIARRLFRQSPKGPWIVPSSQISKFTGHDNFGLRRLAELSGIDIKLARSRLSVFPA